jgi:hypothetical protein
MSGSTNPFEPAQEPSTPPRRSRWERIFDYLKTSIVVIAVAVVVDKIVSTRGKAWLCQTNESLNTALDAANPINDLGVFCVSTGTPYSFEQKMLDYTDHSKIPGIGLVVHCIEVPFFVVHLIQASFVTAFHILFPNVAGFVIGLASLPVVLVPTAYLISTRGIWGVLAFPFIFALVQSILLGLIMLVSLPLAYVVSAPTMCACTGIIAVPARALMEHHIAEPILKTILKRA